MTDDPKDDSDTITYVELDVCFAGFEVYMQNMLNHVDPKEHRKLIQDLSHHLRNLYQVAE